MAFFVSNISPFFNKLKSSAHASLAFSGLIALLLFSSLTSANDWQDINWQSYEEARALDSEKPIFVFAELHFCGACKKMKEEVFNQSDIIATINRDFIPVNMKSLGIFPNTLPDLKDTDGETLSLMGSPALVIVYKNQYKLVYGFQNQVQLSNMLEETLQQIENANS